MEKEQKNDHEPKNNFVYTSEVPEVGTAEQKKMSAAEQTSLTEQEQSLASSTLIRLQEESALLRELFNNASHDLENLKKPALLVAELVHILGDKAIISLPNGNRFYCYLSKMVSLPKEGDTVLVEQRSLNIVDKISWGAQGDVERFVILQKPTENWKEIGGLGKEIEEIKEVIELPLSKPHLFEKVGIQPPKGILLYGPPGTGKTLLAKAVAHSTKATFIEVVGSELVQKFIGEGAKLVKEIFALARKKAPSIIFIDEIDALAATRMDIGTSGEREVNRTFMQLLAEVDGFKNLDKVKIIGATNRPDILDSALIRPGRLDRLIEVGLPTADARLEILKVHTKKMSLRQVDLKDIAARTEQFSGAELKAVCTEAGYAAIREGRQHVTQEDFLAGIEKVQIEEEDEGERMIG